MQYDFLYKKLEKTLVLPDNIKQKVLLHFDKLNGKQLQVLSELLKFENAILLDFLKKQKDSDNIPVTDLKNKYIKYRREQRKNLETKEQDKEKQDLEYLLSAL